MNDPEAQAFMAAEKAHDHSSEGEKYAYAAEAGTASAEVKARYFEEYVHSESIQEDWLTQSLRPFNSWNQATLTAPYLTRALDALAEIKQHRKIFFLGAWLDAFIGGQNNLQASQGAQVAVKAWLAGEKIDADLRLKVLQAADALDRTVAIKQKFPE
jgi:aminopeptidase N